MKNVRRQLLILLHLTEIKRASFDPGFPQPMDLAALLIYVTYLPQLGPEEAEGDSHSGEPEIDVDQEQPSEDMEQGSGPLEDADYFQSKLFAFDHSLASDWALQAAGLACEFHHGQFRGGDFLETLNAVEEDFLRECARLHKCAVEDDRSPVGVSSVGFTRTVEESLEANQSLDELMEDEPEEVIRRRPASPPPLTSSLPSSSLSPPSPPRKRGARDDVPSSPSPHSHKRVRIELGRNTSRKGHTRKGVGRAGPKKAR